MHNNFTSLQKHRKAHAPIREQLSKSAHLPDPTRAGTKYPIRGKPSLRSTVTSVTLVNLRGGLVYVIGVWVLWLRWSLWLEDRSLWSYDVLQVLCHAHIICSSIYILHAWFRWSSIGTPVSLERAMSEQNYVDQGGNVVGVNQRALIDKMLARYSTDFGPLRELLQNADDAGSY